MKKLIGVAALMAMAGCVSVNETRSNPPLVDITSTKPPIRVAECIRDQWQRITVLGASFAVNLQSTGDVYSVIADLQMPTHLADVSPDGDGSHVKYHFYRTWQSPIDKFPDAVRACAR
ncbi:TPA: hypothetical protein ACPWJD_005801 [Pseudomonas aeruginosa]|uniref:hypothetical protein n=1 Tax=Pseudomonas aeruginosa TaxID=287 RepID=UPI000689D240|nr:hypothetical protein [Pseudomonas aeruginosa]AON71099.1 hypothetical protein BG483_07980 [Pseudomonas aeruginosa]MBQ0240671.1 hypothetical protein [Pseudomonas aeruginosa]MBQ0295934.1 hypothetical protein [Pseudomonas aeruginosa]MBT0641005.1 hypothetical protein [Pseudomonas aeruginosa]MBV7719963.1 hypothetical protein [Pseudomonas aeruginosa]